MPIFNVLITINAVDISSNLSGFISVQAEASMARLATFTFKPATGVVNVNDWIGAPVTIDHVDDPLGTPVVTRLFAGVVNLPTYDPTTRLVSMDCTDNLQGHFEAMDQAAILAAMPGGKYSEAVFGPRDDGWQQAMDVLSTVPYDYDLNRDGGTPSFTAWSAKSTPDVIITSADRLDSPVDLQLAHLIKLVNRVTISVQYRYTRLQHREHGFGWNWGNTFCTYYAESHTLALRTMVKGAVDGAGWMTQGGINYETLPVSGTYDCGGPSVWIIADADLNQLVINAAWTAVKRWTQTITEEYTITVDEASSQALFGLAQTEESLGYQQEYDDAQWDQSTETATPAWPVNAIGDYTEDQLDRTESDNNIETLLQLAHTTILHSHRQNRLTIVTPIIPDLERHQTVSIDAGAVTGIGKIYQYTHKIDIDNGSAMTELTIAISRSGSGGTTSPLTAPTPPDTEPTHAAPSASTVLPTRIGNDDTVPNYDAAWEGFTGNYTAANGTPTPEQIYPWRFRVVTPDIEAESRDASTVIADTGLAYTVQAPNETLIIYG